MMSTRAGLREEGPVLNADFNAAVDVYRQALNVFLHGDPQAVAEHFYRT